MKSRMKIQTNHIKYGYYKRKHRLTLNIYHLEQTSQTESNSKDSNKYYFPSTYKQRYTVVHLSQAYP